MSDYNRESVDMHSWLGRPKRGYEVDTTNHGNVLRLWIDAPNGWFGIDVDLPALGWRPSVARGLVYLRNYVRQQARMLPQDRPRPSTRLQVVS